MMTRIKLLNLALLAGMALFFLNACTPSQSLGEDWEDFVPHSGQSVFDMMNQQEVVEVTLMADLDSLILHRRTEDYQAAEFTYTDEKGVPHFFQAKVKPRGKFRRKVCDFPPLKLKFSKKELEAAGLTDMNELKLVTHCMDDKALSKDLVLREYLVYKMYNELTPNSYRTQLVKITYVDRDDRSRKMTRWAFLMEDDEELARRTGSSICDTMGKQAEDINSSQEKIAAVFQYMVGNTDWSIVMKRNVELLRFPKGKLVPVPYDFDFSNFVRAPYARPNVDVGQRRLDQRVFMGYATTPKELYSTFSYFQSKRTALTEIVQNFRQLDPETRQELVTWIDSFYDAIQTESYVQETLFAKNP